MKNIKSFHKDITNDTDSGLVKVLDISKNEYLINLKILDISIDFILKTEMFYGQLF